MESGNGDGDGNGNGNGNGHGHGHGHGHGITQSVGAVVATMVDAIRHAGHSTTESMERAFESSGRALTARVVNAAVTAPKPVGDPRSLASALSKRPGAPLLGGATATAIATRVARRFGPLRFMARRTPLWLMAAGVPALYASVGWGAEELRLVASHLTHRARQAGVEPDPERVRRATVQLLSGATVQPETDPRHGPLLVAWLQRALRSALPFGAGISTRDPDRLAEAAAAVPPSLLAPAGGGDGAPAA